jgi:hypothetical protein
MEQKELGNTGVDISEIGLSMSQVQLKAAALIDPHLTPPAAESATPDSTSPRVPRVLEHGPMVVTPCGSVRVLRLRDENWFAKVSRRHPGVSGSGPAS